MQQRLCSSANQGTHIRTRVVAVLCVHASAAKHSTSKVSAVGCSVITTCLYESYAEASSGTNTNVFKHHAKAAVHAQSAMRVATQKHPAASANQAPGVQHMQEVLDLVD